MARINILKKINAPIATVFNTIADIREFAKARPHVIECGITSTVVYGVGTRFYEIRKIDNRETKIEFEITEFEKDNKVRIVSDSHGAIWDTTFTVESELNVTKLTMVMDVKAYSMISHLMSPKVLGKIKSSIDGDMDMIKEYCEKSS